MIRLAATVLLAGFLAGCMPTRPESPQGASDGQTPAEHKIAARVPLVTAESVTEHNAAKMAQALMDEMKQDAENPPKVLVQAKK